MQTDKEKFEVFLDHEDLEKLSLQSWEYPPEAEKAVSALKTRLMGIFCTGVPLVDFSEERTRCFNALEKLRGEIGTKEFPETQVSDEILSRRTFSNSLRSLGEYLLEDIGLQHMEKSIEAGCQDILDSSSEPQFGKVNITTDPQTLECKFSTNIPFDEASREVLRGVAYATFGVSKNQVLEKQGDDWTPYLDKGKAFVGTISKTPETKTNAPEP